MNFKKKVWFSNRRAKWRREEKEIFKKRQSYSPSLGQQQQQGNMASPTGGSHPSSVSSPNSKDSSKLIESTETVSKMLKSPHNLPKGTNATKNFNNSSSSSSSTKKQQQQQQQASYNNYANGNEVDVVSNQSSSSMVPAAYLPQSASSSCASASSSSSASASCSPTTPSLYVTTGPNMGHQNHASNNGGFPFTLNQDFNLNQLIGGVNSTSVSGRDHLDGSSSSSSLLNHNGLIDSALSGYDEPKYFMPGIV